MQGTTPGEPLQCVYVPVPVHAPLLLCPCMRLLRQLRLQRLSHRHLDYPRYRLFMHLPRDLFFPSALSTTPPVKIPASQWLNRHLRQCQWLRICLYHNVWLQPSREATVRRNTRRVPGIQRWIERTCPTCRVGDNALKMAKIMSIRGGYRTRQTYRKAVDSSEGQ